MISRLDYVVGMTVFFLGEAGCIVGLIACVTAPAYLLIAGLPRTGTGLK